VRHYCLFTHCSPRIRAWRARVTNTRISNHNILPGFVFPGKFVLRHYPMRSEAQMERRLEKDRAQLKRGMHNTHYELMKQYRDRLRIPASQLHYDDGKSDLSLKEIFDWDLIYHGKAA
jgi:hypothetical protein